MSDSSGKYDVIVVNYANLDMVGHTGVWEAAVRAAEAVDECIGMVVEAVIKHQGGKAIITADHGNAEEMMEGGHPKTAHTTNPVPFILIGERRHQTGEREPRGYCPDNA